MNPAVIAAATTAAGLAAKGISWGYKGWKKGQAEKKCVRTIMDAPAKLSEWDARELKCAASLFCKQQAPDVKSAHEICQMKKGRN